MNSQITKHHVASNANICVTEQGFAHEFIFSTLIVQTLFVFSCFDAQLSWSHTYGHALVHTLLIVRRIIAMVEILEWYNCVKPSPDELAKWRHHPGSILNSKIVTP